MRHIEPHSQRQCSNHKARAQRENQKEFPKKRESHDVAVGVPGQDSRKMWRECVETALPANLGSWLSAQRQDTVRDGEVAGFIKDGVEVPLNFLNAPGPLALPDIHGVFKMP